MLLIFNVVIANAAQTINNGGESDPGVYEPHLWTIISDMTAGDISIVEEINQDWVNDNQSGQEEWNGPYANITAYATHAYSWQALSWETGSGNGYILTGDTDGTFSVNIDFVPDDQPWWFSLTSQNGNTISPKNTLYYDIVAFTFADYYIVAFEDLEYGSEWGRDGDYQDLVVKFSVVPEPVSSTLFIIGSLAFGFRHFRNKKRNFRKTS